MTRAPVASATSVLWKTSTRKRNPSADSVLSRLRLPLNQRDRVLSTAAKARRDNWAMARYVFRPHGLESTPITTVKKVARGHGATVLKVVGDLMLLEMTPAKAASFALELQG